VPISLISGDSGQGFFIIKKLLDSRTVSYKSSIVMASHKDSKLKNKDQLLNKQALRYHEGDPSKDSKPGKLEIQPTKSLSSQRDLSFAYSPGVAEPCRAIQEDELNAYKYTARGNLVAVVTNGTAVLGLGDIGPLASKPVMEGKAVLFKKFADIDCFDIELNCPDPKKLIEAVEALEPTFGGINLEDIKAPDCFEVETTLKERLKIPVFHDDQHGTAIISGAALINALEISGKKIEEVKVVFCGGGAASISCARFWLKLGVRLENTVMTDRSGVLYEGRSEDMNQFKAEFSIPSGQKRWLKEVPKTLEDAMHGADVFIGCSVGGVLSQSMLKTMAAKPVVFALANPDPEITYEDAHEARQDLIYGSGRSDYPNQINNVLCFPFLFRGALDTHASAINEEMKIAAAMALSRLAKENVPDSVINAYAKTSIEFGEDYIIPKPFDSRALTWVAPAVADAAIKSGVARSDLPGGNLKNYTLQLEKIQGKRHSVMRDFRSKSKKLNRKQKKIRILFPEGDNEKILKAAAIIQAENIAEPILCGAPNLIQERIKQFHLEDDLVGVETIRPRMHASYEEYANLYFERRSRKGLTLSTAQQDMKDPFFFSAMHMDQGYADVCLAGLTRNYADILRPNLLIIGARENKRVSGVYMHIWKERVLFLSDTTVHTNPNAEELVAIAENTAELARFLGFDPRVAMLSYSNFGSSRSPEVDRVRAATQILQEKYPDLVIDGEMQADVAVNADLLKSYPFTRIPEEKSANILVFPNLAASNTSYKLLGQLGGAEMIGPILVGMKKPVHVLQRSSTVEEIVNMAVISVLDARHLAEES